MADRPTERRARTALADLQAGKLQDVAAFLAKLGDVAVPSITQSRRDKSAALRGEIRVLEARIRVLDRALAEAQAQAARTVSTDNVTVDIRPIRPVPKPHRRHVDKDRVAAFRALYTRCAVLTCGREHADPHHLWSRGNRGDDDWANLVPLCPGPGGHHDEIEDIGTAEFRARYVSRLSEVDSLKMRLAMAMEAQAKLADTRAKVERALRMEE